MTPVNEWAFLTAPELRERAQADALAIVPVGSLEQHGPHLATGTDILLATEVAARTAARLSRDGVPPVVTPCVWTGLAEHHMGLGGTVTLDPAAFAAVLGGVVRSAARVGFRRVMLLNGHGGNAEAVALAAAELGTALGIAVLAGTYWHVVPEVIAPLLERQPHLMHACEAETSMVLAMRPDMVRLDRLAEAHGPPTTRVPGQPSGLVRRRPFESFTETGVVGDARAASAAKGKALLDAIADAMARVLANPALWDAGRGAPDRTAS